jgi:hypothetical protein
MTLHFAEEFLRTIYPDRPVFVLLRRGESLAVEVLIGRSLSQQTSCNFVEGVSPRTLRQAGAKAFLEKLARSARENMRNDPVYRNPNP